MPPSPVSPVAGMGHATLPADARPGDWICPGESCLES